jgi:uncharacterized repeat protein (TIGR01451 family)
MLVCAASVHASTLTYDAPANPVVRMTLKASGDRVVIIDDSSYGILASAPAMSTTRVEVRGAGDNKDTMTIDVRSLVLPGGVEFDGGDGGFDTIAVTGDGGQVETTSQSAHDGDIVAAGIRIHYAGLEPVDMSGLGPQTINAGGTGSITVASCTLTSNPAQAAICFSQTGTETVKIALSPQVTLNASGNFVNFNAADFTAAGIPQFNISNATSITQGLGDVTLANAAFQSTGTITLTSPTNSIGVLAASTPGNVTVVAGGTLQIGTVNSINGLSGNIVQLEANHLVFSQNVTANANLLIDTVNSGATDDITVNGGATLQSTTSFVQIQADDNLVNAGAINAPAGFIQIGTTNGSVTSTGSINAATGAIVNSATDITVAAVNATTSAGTLFFNTGTGGTFTASGGSISTVGALANNIAVQITADDMVISELISGGASSVQLLAKTNTKAFDLGTNTPGRIGLTGAEVADFGGSQLRIGTNTYAGDVFVTGAVSYPSALFIQTAGNLVGAGGAIVAPRLSLGDFSSTPRTWTLSDSSVNEGLGAFNVNLSTELDVLGGSGADTFNVALSGFTVMQLDGGNPVGAPGDTLIVPLAAFPNATVTYAGSNGGISGGGTAGLLFFGMEAFNPSSVSVTKVGPPTAGTSSNATYVITISNAGPNDAGAPQITDVLPAGVTFVSYTQASGPGFLCSTPAVGSAGTFQCSRSTLLAGQSASFDLTVKMPAAGASVSNTANESVVTTNLGVTTATAVTALVTNTDLAITKTAPLTAVAGGAFSYTISAINNGPIAATTVAIDDILPAPLQFVSLTQTAGPAFACTTPAPNVNGTVHCSIASLAAGASATFTLAVSSAASTTGSSSNTAVISSATSDSNITNNSSTAATTFTAQADLGILKSSSSTANAGSNVTYTLSVTNNGPSDAQTVVMNDVLPASLRFTSFAQTSGPAFACTTPAAGTTGTINCTIATLPGAASATFILVATVDPALTPGTSISNTATIASATADAAAGNNTSTSTLSSAASIPALSPAMLGVLALALAIAAMVTMKR